MVDKIQWTTDVTALVSECRRLFETDKCILVARESLLHRHYSMAALAHCCVVLERMDDERKHGDEIVLRLLARSHFETWLTGAWLHFGGYDNAVRFIGANRKALTAQREGFEKYNDRIVKERARVATYNAKVEQNNEGIRARNARTGEDIPLRGTFALPCRRVTRPARSPTAGGS